MVQMKHVLTSLLLASLVGCATLNEKECRSINWTEMGRSDGIKGYELTRRDQQIAACGDYGANPDVLAYRTGREEGLHQYCTPENALQVGIDGGTYRQVCAGEAGALFSIVHARGLVLHAIKDDMQDVQDRLDAERGAQVDVKDSALNEKLDQNASYLEREKLFVQRQYEQALFSISSGFDPPFLDIGEWRSGIPYPDALRDTGKKFKDKYYDH